MRILFAGGGTGGHLYPALALADAFERRVPGAEVFFVGARRGVEARVLPERGVPHVLLPLEPIRRDRVWQNWRLLPAMLRTSGGLRRLFRQFRPDLVVGTGGYASGPAAFYALLRSVPVALQEQNSFPGLVTRLLAPRVRQLHLAFPEARKHLKPGAHTQVFEFGNPIRPPDFTVDRTAARRGFGLGEGPVVLVVGGSQGARNVNRALLADLRALVAGQQPGRPGEMEILWATGPNHFDAVRDGLAGLGLSSWVHAVPYIQDMPSALRSADLAVSRAGAMALAELCAWGLPMILVPLPTAAANHQYHNAAALAEAGAARMVQESELQPGRLWGEIRALAADSVVRQALADGARRRGQPDAADQIVEALSALRAR